MAVQSHGTSSARGGDGMEGVAGDGGRKGDKTKKERRYGEVENEKE